MSFEQIIPGFIKKVQPPVLPVSETKTEAPTIIKNEPPESEMVQVGVGDIKDIDIVMHKLCEGSVKSETFPTNIHEIKHSVSLERQAFVKTENTSFVKIENIAENENLAIKTEDTSDDGGQEVVEVQDSNEHFNALGYLKTDEQLENFSKDLNALATSSRKAKHPKATNFVECYKTIQSTSWEKDKEKVKVIEAPVSLAEPHEYTSLAQDRHVCNHCQYAFNKLKYVKFHIKKMHRKVTRMYQCPYCPYMSKWSVREHVIRKHKDAEDIQWFQCHLCEMKFRIKSHMIKHSKVHLTIEQMQDRLKLCPVCGKGFKQGCSMRRHMRTIHYIDDRNKEIKCQKCEFTTTESQLLKHHIESTHKKDKRHSCTKCSFITGQYAKFKIHELSHKTKTEMDDEDLKYCCDKCDYITHRHPDLKRHKMIHLTPEEIPYVQCYHCSYKSKRKEHLRDHIFRHFRNKEITFHCYICNFKTLNRTLIAAHIKKHSKIKPLPI